MTSEQETREQFSPVKGKMRPNRSHFVDKIVIWTRLYIAVLIFVYQQHSIFHTYVGECFRCGEDHCKIWTFLTPFADFWFQICTSARTVSMYAARWYPSGPTKSRYQQQLVDIERVSTERTYSAKKSVLPFCRNRPHRLLIAISNRY